MNDYDFSKLKTHESINCNTKRYLEELVNYYKSLDYSNKKVIHTYTDTIVTLISGELIPKELTRDQKDRLDEIIEKSPVNTHSFTVYRGVKLDDIELFIQDTRDFTSTSLDKDIARNFLNLYGPDIHGLSYPCCILEIIVPIGKHMLFLGFFEEEILFNRDTTLRIIEQIDDHTYTAVML